VDKELFQGGKCSIVDVINKSTTYLPTQVAVPGKREELEEFLKQLLDASHWQKAIALLKEATTYKALRLASHLEVIPANFHRHIHTQTQRNDSNSSSEGVSTVVSPKNGSYVILTRDYRKEINQQPDKATNVFLAIKEVSSQVAEGKILIEQLKA
jgi:hypothetical protein